MLIFMFLLHIKFPILPFCLLFTQYVSFTFIDFRLHCGTHSLARISTLPLHSSSILFFLHCLHFPFTLFSASLPEWHPPLYVCDWIHLIPDSAVSGSACSNNMTSFLFRVLPLSFSVPPLSVCSPWRNTAVLRLSVRHCTVPVTLKQRQTSAHENEAKSFSPWALLLWQELLCYCLLRLLLFVSTSFTVRETYERQSGITKTWLKHDPPWNKQSRHMEKKTRDIDTDRI